MHDTEETSWCVRFNVREQTFEAVCVTCSWQGEPVTSIGVATVQLENHLTSDQHRYLD